MLYKTAVFKNFAKVTGKYLCRILFLNKVAAWVNGTLFKSDFDTNVFRLILQNL